MYLLDQFFRSSTNHKDTFRIFEVHRTQSDEFGAENESLESMQNEISQSIFTIITTNNWMSTAYGGILAKGAIQEFIEGVLFRHYMDSGGKDILNLNQLNYLLFSETHCQSISYKDYVMGVLDFTGEIMRFGISHPSGYMIKKGMYIYPSVIVKTIRIILQHVEDLSHFSAKIDYMLPGFSQKHKTIKASLSKMEKVLYETELRKRLCISKEKELRHRRIKKRVFYIQ